VYLANSLRLILDKAKSLALIEAIKLRNQGAERLEGWLLAATRHL
jgi:hypothetical protein